MTSLGSNRVLLSGFILSCTCILQSVAKAETPLSSVKQHIDAMANVDPLTAKPNDEHRVTVAALANGLPQAGRFYRMAIKTGGGGYPGANLNFDSPVDLSKHDVLALWLKNDLPISYFTLVLNIADGTTASYNLFEAAIPPAARLQPGVWHRVYLPYKVDRSEIRPAGKQVDFSQVKGLTFYVYGETLSIKQPVYNYSFGGMTLLTMQEAKARFPLTQHRPPVVTAARLSKDDQCLVWTADAGEKIWKDTSLPEAAPSAAAASASGAGNEYVSLLSVVNPTRDLNGITAEVSDLLSGGNRIGASEVTLRYVDSIPGLFFDAPDPLPLLGGKSLSARAGENFQLWTTVHIPANQPAGTYTGTITFKDSQGLSRSVPLQVQVYGFSLPNKGHLQSLFTIQDLYGSGPKFMEERSERYWGKHVTPFSKDYETVVRNIIRGFGEHRITPQLDIGNWFDFLTTKERLALHERYGFDPAFILGMNIANEYAAAEPMTPEKHDALLNRWTTEGEKYKAAGLAPLTVVKIDDEASGERLKYSLMAAQDAKAAMPFIQSFMTVTGRDLPQAFCGYMNTWCPVWGIFDFQSKQAMERKAAGDRFWVYGVEYKNNDAYDPMDLRVPYWLYWKYGITGTHYSHDAHKAFLTYPNDTYPHSDGLDPIPSIRWEMIRHGAQDYEYLWMLNDLIQKNTEKGAPYRNLLDVPQSLANNENEFTHDARMLLNQREQLAHAIEALTQP